MKMNQSCANQKRLGLFPAHHYGCFGFR